MTQLQLFDEKVKTVVDIARDHADLFRPDFLEWLPHNLHIWEGFERQTLAVIKRGFKHYSSRTIIEVLRHHSALHEAGDGWKINNNITAFLPRLFDLVHPEHIGLWEYRQTKSVVKKACDYPRDRCPMGHPHENF